MSPAIGTSSDCLDFAPHLGRIEHRHAACERASACHDPCVTERDADCFERGPVPFADFLYHENRRLELEHPRTLAIPTVAHSPDQDNPLAASSHAAEPSTEGRPIETGKADRKVSRDGAIVMNLSRPTLVAKFIDLYA